MASSTRDLIIDTASNLFYERGYNLVGINEIINESGIAKATLYNHFKSKEDLCLAYLDKMNADLMEDMSVYCASKTKGKKRIVSILEFVRELYGSKNFNGCWCVRTFAEVPQTNKLIRQKIKESKDNLMEFINGIVSENLTQTNKIKVSKLSRVLYLLYESAVTESHLQGEPWPIDENIDVLKVLLK